MEFIADILLISGALAATAYCVVLSRRLRRFTDLERGVGGAIAALSNQVDDMTRTLQSAQGAATASVSSLGDLTGRAESAARRLELLVASMHDLPDPAAAAPAPVSRPEPAVLPRSARVPAEPGDATPPAADDAPGVLFASRRATGGTV